MSKFENDDFLAKFANRVEKVGRDGVMGLMKSTGVPINIDRQNNYNNQNYFDSYKRRNYTNEIHKNIIEENNSAFAPRNKNNIYVNQLQNKFPTKNYDIRNIKHYSFVGDNNTGIFSTKSSMPGMNDNDFNNNNINHSQRNSLLRSMNMPMNTNHVYNPNENNDNFISRSQVRKNSMNYRYNNQNNLFEDYKKISNDVKLGKLGPNIGTEEWVQKRNRMKKMSEYGNKVIYEGKGCKNKVSESADDRHRRLQEFKALNGKWNIINEYSKGLLLNKDKNSNEQFKRNANDKLLEEERLIDKQFELDIRENEEEERMLQQQNNILYQQRLNRMKNLLFK